MNLSPPRSCGQPAADGKSTSSSCGRGCSIRLLLNDKSYGQKLPHWLYGFEVEKRFYTAAQAICDHALEAAQQAFDHSVMLCCTTNSPCGVMMVLCRSFVPGVIACWTDNGADGALCTALTFEAKKWL